MPKSERWRIFLICAVLAVGTAALYAPTGNFDFVNYDDQTYLLNNFNVNRGLTWENIKWAFQIGYASNWHPLTWLSHQLDCQLFLLRPGLHHLVSALLHVLNSVSLFLVLLRLTGRAWRGAMVAALFAWHPMHVESVAWISERKDVLSALFFLLTFWAYARFVEETNAKTPKRRMFYWLAVGLFALGLMAKPMVVTLPFLLLLIDAWPLRRLEFGLSKKNKRTVNGRKSAAALLVEKIPFFLLAAASCALTLLAQSQGAVRTLQETPMRDRLLNAALSYGRYAGKLLWPAKLEMIYPFHYDLPAAPALVALLLVAGILATGVVLWKRYPYLLVGWLWFVGSLVPVIGLVHVGAAAMADRYWYLPSIGFFIMICWGAFDLAERWPRWRPAFSALAVVVLAGCWWTASKQVQTWRNGATLGAHAVEVDPGNYLARAGYAAFLLDMGALEPARQQCQLALDVQPDYPAALQFMGIILFQEGRFAEAQTNLERALSMDPYLMDGMRQLGFVYLALNQPAKAEAAFRKLLKADPAVPSGHCGLGQALAMEGRADEAIPELLEGIRVIYKYPEAHYALAWAYASLHKSRHAVDEYGVALAQDSNMVKGLNNLAWLLATDPDASIRDGARAVTLAERARQLAGDHQPTVLGTLAAAYAEAGRFDDALATVRAAHELAVAQNNSGVASQCLVMQAAFEERRAYRESR